MLLADEPTGNLDTRNSNEIMHTLVQFNREQGVTVIIVTHEPDIAAYADRVITMRDGGVVSDQRRDSTLPTEPDTARYSRRIATAPLTSRGAVSRADPRTRAGVHADDRRRGAAGARA